MIRIIDKETTLSPDDLIGKWIMKEGMFQWPSFSRPYRVTSISKSRVNMEVPYLTKVDGNRLSLSQDPEIEKAKYMPLSSVACICDTVAEVNLVIAQGFAARDRWNQMLGELRDDVAALDGMSEPDPDNGPRP